MPLIDRIIDHKLLLHQSPLSEETNEVNDVYKVKLINNVYMKKRIYLLLLLAMCISCSQQEQDVVPSQDTATESVRYAPIPVNAMAYTSPSELHSLYLSDPNNVIHYRVARLIASTELLAGANFALGVDPYEGFYLTSLPKVVYNYDNTPKYYEFGYVCNGDIVATIVTYAQKEIDGVIAYLFPAPLNYDCPFLDYYIGKYPSRYYGTGGTCYLKSCDEEIEGELEDIASTDAEELEKMLEQMGTEDRDAIQQDMDEQGESMGDGVAERDEYWNDMDAFIEDYLSDLLTEDEPNEPEILHLGDFLNGSAGQEEGTDSYYINHLAEQLDYELGYFNTYTLPEYSDPRLQVTHWAGYCGPAACAWVYRGKYSQYNGVYLPIYGDDTDQDRHFYDYQSNYYAYYSFAGVDNSDAIGVNDALDNYVTRSNEADNGLTACFYNETAPFWHNHQWEFPLYHGGLNRGFNTATNGVYQVKFTCKPYDWITLNNEPVIIAINCNHYIVAFGTGVTKKKNGRVKDKYFAVTDNGYTTAASNYHPYMRKHNCWNLHYGLTR